MGFISLAEFINLIILTLVVGYVFSGYIRDPSRPAHKKLQLNDFLFALLVSAPGVVLHELGHKFVAMTFGLTAEFFVFWWGLGIAVFLKLISSPFILLAPGYVGISVISSPSQSFFVSFAGPAVNLLLFLIAAWLLNNVGKLTRKQATFLYLTKKINLFLFVFNMIPLPPLDGSKVFLSLFKILSASA